MPYAAVLMPLLVMVGVTLMVGIVFLWRYLGERSGKRNPAKRKLMRSPGETLRGELDEARWDLSAYLAMGMLPLPAAMGLYLGTWLAAGRAPGAAATAYFALFACMAQGWFAWKLWKTLSLARRLKLSYEAEVAVGQELADLGVRGYRVFHDFPVDDLGFNIDHIVVGPGGVFAVETRARSKPATDAYWNAAWEVESDGKVLKFPGWVDSHALRQASAASSWLGTWLTNTVGEGVRVDPLVVLPGWYVRRTAQTGVPVIALKEIGRRIAGSRLAEPLSEKLVRQIAHQLSERCREVPPKAYSAVRSEVKAGPRALNA